MSQARSAPRLTTQPPGRLESSDAWAWTFFARLMAGTLTTAEFEEAVRARWSNGDFILRAPTTAAALLAIATGSRHPCADYANDAPHLGFESQWLAGERGYPGAIHIQAPPETGPRGALGLLNRAPHEHDSGRIALVTRGHAVFHVARFSTATQPLRFDCPVGPGDLIFWPPWTPHTFDARQGFSLVSAMAAYVSPAEDGFVYPAREDLDAMPPAPPAACR